MVKQSSKAREAAPKECLPIRILTLTTVYPSELEPSLGIFVRTRLAHIAKSVEAKVMVPVPILNYSRRIVSLRFLRSKTVADGQLQVIQSGWLYPPGGGALNAVILFLQLLRAVKRIRRDFPFEILDAHFGHPEGVAAALLASALHCPFTVTMRGSEHLHAKYRFRRVTMGWALRQAARVFPVSERLRALAISLGVDPRRVITIPNGIDTDLFHPRGRQQCRRESGVPDGSKLVVSVGNLTELKGHHRTIEAVHRLRLSGQDAQLIIAGARGRSADYGQFLEEQIGRLGLRGAVRLAGHLDRMALARLLAAADVLCLASSREGWPNVVQEALACGTPVVATDVGAIPQMIPSAQYGIVVPPGDTDALYEGLKIALCRNWDHAEVARWGSVRSWATVAEEVLREWGNVLAEVRRN